MLDYTSVIINISYICVSRYIYMFLCLYMYIHLIFQFDTFSHCMCVSAFPTNLLYRHKPLEGCVKKKEGFLSVSQLL